MILGLRFDENNIYRMRVISSNDYFIKAYDGVIHLVDCLLDSYRGSVAYFKYSEAFCLVKGHVI